MLFGVFINLYAIAQLTKGQVVYDIKIEAETEEMKAAAQMMGNMSMEILFAPGKSKGIMKMGILMTMTTVVNAESEEMLILMEGMTGQKAILSNLSELEEQAQEKNEATNVSLFDNQRTIAGYACKKAVIEDADGNEITYWYTEEIEVEKRGQENLNADIPGFPMEFETSANGMKMTFTVTEVKETFDQPEEEVFSLAIPDGYEIMELEDLMKQ